MKKTVIDDLEETLEYMESSSYPESCEMSAKANRMIVSVREALNFIKRHSWRKATESLPEYVGNYLTNGEYGITILTFIPNKRIWVGAEDFHTPVHVTEWTYLLTPEK